MKLLNLALAACIMLATTATAQKRVLTGVITMNNQPVAGLKVFTNFYETFTDVYGRYAIKMQDCKNCNPGDIITINTYKENLGSWTESHTINKNFTHDFAIRRRPSYMLVHGMVQNAATGDPLQNIEVMVIAARGINTKPVKTDARVFFSIPIDLDQVEGNNAVRLLTKDPNGTFRPLRATPELYQLNTFNTLLMEGRKTHEIKVAGPTRTKVCFTKNNIITIEAQGQIRVGTFVGNSDPDGRASGVFNLSLESYNIISGINHAALLYRITGDRDWQLAGKQARFVAPRDGCIEFEINDNNQTDNYGAYIVRVYINAQ